MPTSEEQMRINNERLKQFCDNLNKHSWKEPPPPPEDRIVREATDAVNRSALAALDRHHGKLWEKANIRKSLMQRIVNWINSL